MTSEWLSAAAPWSFITPCRPSGRNRGQSPARVFCRPVREEEELDADTKRPRMGIVGRIVVYAPNERPCCDIVLKGGGGQQVRVERLAQTGKAARSGVVVGDVLVSINGNKNFSDKPLEQILAGLASPVALVFLGPVGGKRNAELHIKRKEKTCGLSEHLHIVSSALLESTEVVDEVIFDSVEALDEETEQDLHQELRYACEKVMQL
mmetsp:Transcript_21552/g.50224  ORF Transcript_21552/g.50224 Transcript_21552/m.50224 type:complete len:207 (-) Transcript_21552:104-724(-)|eukprot:CAMPEP_0171072100 /NCGR_PEP_ID=MMETSP0766_2-20121228/10668_1 /TAXON_ID=439317 /ORGANISM="Gambierdiscus australes, Strain CAWD 149" /LENGTH=206 /DNA_ID=CAMNT_0011528663 /DNA_START=138 /DNA_END=758 /DNA_ORIENTATION=-